MKQSEISHHLIRVMEQLSEIDQRVQALEQMMYRAAGRPSEMPNQEDAETNAVAASSAQTEMALISEEELKAMSSTEIAQVANERGLRLDRFMDREIMIDLILNPEPVEDRLQAVREEISHFINEVQPSLRQILQCSKQCVEVCPAIRVVDCWASNRQKIQEV